MKERDILYAISELLFDEEISRKYKEELLCIRKIINRRINPGKEIEVVTGGPV